MRVPVIWERSCPDFEALRYKGFLSKGITNRLTGHVTDLGAIFHLRCVGEISGKSSCHDILHRQRGNYGEKSSVCAPKKKVSKTFAHHKSKPLPILLDQFHEVT